MEVFPAHKNTWPIEWKEPWATFFKIKWRERNDLEREGLDDKSDKGKGVRKGGSEQNKDRGCISDATSWSSFIVILFRKSIDGFSLLKQRFSLLNDGMFRWKGERTQPLIERHVVASIRSAIGVHKESVWDTNTRPWYGKPRLVEIREGRDGEREREREREKEREREREKEKWKKYILN